MSEIDRPCWMNATQWECWKFLSRVVFGFSRLDTWKVDRCTDEGIEYRGIYSVSTSDNTSAFGDCLTRLVFMAHKDCFRVSIRPFGDRLIIEVKKLKREGNPHEICPTLEQALAKFEKGG